MSQIIQHFDFKGRRGASALPSVLSDIYSPHRIKVQRFQNKPASLALAKLGQGSLSLLNIPTRNEIVCDATDSYFIVFINGGEVNYEIENQRFQAHAGDGVIINNGESFSRESGDTGADLTVLKLTQPQLNRYLPIEATNISMKGFRLPSRIDLSSPTGGALRRCVQYVQNELTLLDTEFDQLENHVNSLEQFMITTIMDTIGRDSSLAREMSARNVLPGYMKKIISYLHAQCHEPIQLKDLCRIGGVSERTINTGFNLYLNASPKQYLKQLRLMRVHEELRNSEGITRVTDIATRWGFNQLGWFSAEYRKQYGETPSETLKRRA